MYKSPQNSAKFNPAVFQNDQEGLTAGLQDCFSNSTINFNGKKLLHAGIYRTLLKKKNLQRVNSTLRGEALDTL